MAVKNTAKVIIGGKIITLGGYESEEYFQKVASYINKKMDELSAMPGYSRQPMETKHTLPVPPYSHHSLQKYSQKILPQSVFFPLWLYPLSEYS